MLKGKNKTQKDILPFVTQYRPSASNLKQALLTKWHLIQNQPLLCQIFKEQPIISYKKGKSLRDLLVRATIKGSTHVFTQEGNQCGLSLLAFSYHDVPPPPPQPQQGRGHYSITIGEGGASP